MVNPADLVLLAQIRVAGSMAKAARTLGFTPASASGRVARLEREWREPLVRRGARGAELTELGHSLADSGDVVRAECEAIECVRRSAEDRQRIRIGALHSATRTLLPRVLAALQDRHPAARPHLIDVTSEEGIRRVAAGDLDAAVIARHRTTDFAAVGLDGSFLLADPMVLCAPRGHRWTATADADAAMSGLRREPWIAIESGQTARAEFDVAAARAGFKPRVAYETANYAAAGALVSAGVGVALLPRLAADQSADQELLRAPGAPSRHVYAITPRRSRFRVVHTLVELLGAESARLAAGW